MKKYALILFCSMVFAIGLFVSSTALSGRKASAVVEPQENMNSVPCHPGGDLVPCHHALHGAGDLGQCLHACATSFGTVPCHPAGDVYPCTHPAHSMGDLVPCVHYCYP